MGNTRNVCLDVTRKFAEGFYSNCVIAKNLNHDYEKFFGSNAGFQSQKIGPTLNIREPNNFAVRSTWAMNQQDVAESYVPLTINTVRGVDLNFSDAEMAHSIDDIEERYIKPAARQLASEVDKVCADFMAKRIAQSVAATSLAIPTSIDTYLAAGAVMKDSLAPMGSIPSCVLSPTAEAKIINGLAGQYNPQGNISAMFEKGQMSRAAGMDWYMSQVLPTLTTGTTAIADSPLVGTFVSSSPSELPYTSATASGTWTEGQTFTITGLYDVNYETKGVSSRLKQFVVRALNTASGGAGTLSVSPNIVFDTTSPLQNCYIAAGSIDGVAIILDALNYSTSVPTTHATAYKTGLIFHRDSFAFGSVPLYIPEGTDKAAKVSVENLNFRFIRDYDVANGRLISRMDIFFGLCALRPQWAAKILHV